MASLVAVALAAVLDVAFISTRETRDIIMAALVGTVLLVLATALPGRERRRTGDDRARAFDRARAIFDRYGGDTLDYFALRDDKSWLFSGNTRSPAGRLHGCRRHAAGVQPVHPGEPRQRVLP